MFMTITDLLQCIITKNYTIVIYFKKYIKIYFIYVYKTIIFQILKNIQTITLVER